MARSILIVLSVFPRMPESQHVDDGTLNLVPSLILADENSAHLAWIELFQPFPDSRKVEQAGRRRHQEPVRRSRRPAGLPPRGIHGAA